MINKRLPIVLISTVLLQIPGTYQHSGPSFHLLQSAPRAESAKKRVKLSEQNADGRKKVSEIS